MIGYLVEYSGSLLKNKKRVGECPQKVKYLSNRLSWPNSALSYPQAVVGVVGSFSSKQYVSTYEHEFATISILSHI